MVKSFIITKKDFDDIASLRSLKSRFTNLEKITDKWGYIRQGYMEITPAIIATSKKDVSRWVSPYLFNSWASYFSPIEEIAWNHIRSRGGIPLYPQFPVFNYFIDFANPYLKVGLELDGKEHDLESDSKRDQNLFDTAGWKIFRVRGVECYKTFRALYELEEMGIEDEVIIDQELKNWFFNTCDGVVEAIREIYFTKPRNRHPLLFDYALQTLNKHRHVNFEIDDEHEYEHIIGEVDIIETP